MGRRNGDVLSQWIMQLGEKRGAFAARASDVLLEEIRKFMVSCMQTRHTSTPDTHSLLYVVPARCTPATVSLLFVVMVFSLLLKSCSVSLI